MSIKFQCSQCGTSITVKSELAGRKGKCNKCGASLTVPSNATIPIKTGAKPLPRRPPPPPVKGELVPTEQDWPIEHRPQPQPQYVAMQPQAQQVIVNVRAAKHHGNSMGVASMFLGAIAFLFCWIPILGIIAIPLAGLGLLLAALGLLMALARGGRGIGYPIAGGALCAVALAIPILFLGAMGAAIDAGIKSAKENPPGQTKPAEKKPAEKPEPKK